MKRDDIVAFPYTNAEIAAKIDFTPDYAAAICYLLEHGEERLLIAIERGRWRLPAPPTAMFSALACQQATA